MALIYDSISIKTGGSIYLSGSIKVYQDPDDPSVTPYAELSFLSIYASTKDELKYAPTTLSVRLAGISFPTSSADGVSWSSVYGSGTNNFRMLNFSDGYPRIVLSDISIGDSMYCTVSCYQSGFGSIQASGTTYLTQHIAVTPPTNVRLNDVNFFSCTPFTVPDSVLLTYSGSASLRPSNKGCALYIDESTPFGSGAAGRTVSGFYWYPALSLAQPGDFIDGVGEYSLYLNVFLTYKWRSGTYQTGGISSYVVRADFTGGTILYNETPPAAAAPSITLTAEEKTGVGLLAQYGKYIKGKSQVKYTAAVSYKYGAAKSVFDLTVGYNYTTATTYTFWPETDGTATAHAEDDHGNITEVVQAYSVYDYWSPQVSVAIHRCKQDGTRDDSGAYCLIEWSINVAPLGNQNSKSLTIQHPEGSASPTLGSYTASGSLIAAADTEHSYDITLTLTDDFGSIVRTVRLSTAGVIMDIYRGGHGLAFGKVAEMDKTLEISADLDTILNTSNAKQINLIDALVALANKTGVNIYVQSSNS